MEPEVRLRISVMGLFIKSDTVLMIDKVTGPEPNRWDLPGGGLQPGEPIIQSLKREIREETGLSDFRVERLLTIVEGFFPNWHGKLLHSLSIIYQCSVAGEFTVYTTENHEVGARGIQWLPIAELTPEVCSTRSWTALQVADSKSQV